MTKPAADRQLADAARRAAKRLAERQQGPGDRLMSFTGKAAFEQPRPEMNTFLNAMMIDIASPVAEAAGLTGTLRRAREFLTSQIEAGGLVRYHGRPDAPTIGTLGSPSRPTRMIPRWCGGSRRVTARKRCRRRSRR